LVYLTYRQMIDRQPNFSQFSGEILCYYVCH